MVRWVMDEMYREEREDLSLRAHRSASSDPITGVHVTNGQQGQRLTDRLGGWGWGRGREFTAWPYFHMQGRDLEREQEPRLKTTPPFTNVSSKYLCSKCQTLERLS